MQAPIREEEYRNFRRFLEESTGILLGDNKHYLVASRLHRLLEEHQVSSISELLTRLREDRQGSLRIRVVEAMTTNETQWFRDVYPYEILKNLIFPELVRVGARQARIWSAACSTGQEPYSISMVAEEFLAKNTSALPGGVSILATDLSSKAIHEARRAIYNTGSVARGLSEERRRRFLIPAQENGRQVWEVRPEIRSRVTFREINLIQPWTGIGRFDVVFCRNVLIYFSAELKQNLLSRLAGALNAEGWLLLGASESIAGVTDSLKMIRAERSVVYRSVIERLSTPPSGRT
ncbi:Chemotaxis protein methyltransferase Cher2 [Gammaproteobacteria bacterium]